MWNVSIFKKLARLFLKCYVGQQNRSVGCQFVTFVLKQNHCSLTGSFCLSFAKALPGITIESCITTELSTSVIVGLSHAFLQLGLAYSPCLGLSCSIVCPSSPDQPHFHVASGNPVSPFSLFCLTWLCFHQCPCHLAHSGATKFREKHTDPFCGCP